MGRMQCTQRPVLVAGSVEDIKNILVGTDPRAYEMRFADMFRLHIQGPLGARAQAAAGVELALLDIKAKALGISVVNCSAVPLVRTCASTGHTVAPRARSTRRWASRRSAPWQIFTPSGRKSLPVAIRR